MIKFKSLIGYYQNARGLRTKTNVFLANILLNNYDFIAITETWLLDSILSSELFDSRYIIWRRDRDYARTAQKLGGGVLLAVRKDLMVVERSEWRSSAEDIWVTITLKRRNPSINYNIHLCTVYLCNEGSGNSYKTQVLNFSNKLGELVLSHPSDVFLVTGDFNFKDDINWVRSEGSTELLPIEYKSDYLKNFLDIINTCNLSQYNAQSNINQRILDLIFSNSPVNVQACMSPLVPEDEHHKSLILDIEFVEIHTLEQDKTLKFLYNRADFNSITSVLNSIDWHSCLFNCTVDEALTLLYDKLYELRDKFIPSKLVSKCLYPPWYSSALVKILKEKYKYHSKYKIYGNIADYLSFSTLRERAITVEKKCFEVYIDRIEASIVHDPRTFWSYVKSKKLANSYPNFMCYKTTGATADSGLGISNLFSSYFESNFLKPNDTVNVNNSPVSCTSTVSISTVSVTHAKVEKLIRKLDLSKGGGPDLLPPVFIVNCASGLVVPLTIIFQRSLSEGIVPKIWKRAYITPVFKKGDRSNVENYRPISKLCLFAKILEKLVHNDLYVALKPSFGVEQHGFLRSRSTVSNLIIANDFITEGMDSGGQVEVIYTDYTKCFDRIDHSVLLCKLLAAGIHGDLFRWFASYIDNRCQAVVLQGFLSNWVSIPSGVPQGSILGPLMFILFTLDVGDCFLNSKILLFADDMKIFKFVHNTDDINLLQADLNRFEHYCVLNKLELNVSKCHHISFSRKPSPLIVNLNFYNQSISRLVEVKDLGVIHDNKLLFDRHIDSVVSKASKSLGFIIRTSAVFKHLKTIKILYCSFVRSHLEYASQVWNPQYQEYKARLENIQRRFLRFLDFKAHQHSDGYHHRCQRYHFLPLENRRNISDVCYLLQIVRGFVDCPEMLAKLNLRTDLLWFRHRPLFKMPPFNTNYRKNTFLIRSVQTYNQYSTQLDIDLFFSSIDSVRRTLTSSYFH
ncbi:unnamed protein product [Pieris macdunnoughi]|uniref:Reverse transcriptase domain-containing protein n=1 Tax=Pieris macdunnoughi TaxID=345717 RepID=A0A821WAR8_9NEOP|nr:unnamed protein product [Pieris macdunnoughi]